MKCLVVGGDGQLGRSLAETLPDGVVLVSAGLQQLDITREAEVEDFVHRELPDVVINAAAYTAVDRAESEPDVASSVNVDGPRHLAAAARLHGARIIHVSTDFVFDGERDSPYRPEDEARPLGVYGATKLEGERDVIRAAGELATVVRTSWLYSRHGSNFVKTMLRLMAGKKPIGVVGDQVGCPTWAVCLARVLWKLTVGQHLPGKYHWSDLGVVSWYEFAVAIQQEALQLGLLDKEIPVMVIGTSDYPTAAARPVYSVLDCSALCDLLGIQQAPWRENLRKMLKGMTS